MSNNSDLLSIGKQCSHGSCLLVDFLPFKCQHCQKSFCQEHFKVEAHNCDSYDEMKYNRIAPNCPLCNTPIAIRPGQDPNIRMDQHLNRECSVMTGKEPTSSSKPRCARPTCKKVLFSPIRCDKCKEQFCAAHRFPEDHHCRAQPEEPIRTGLVNPSNLLAKFEVGAKSKKAASSGITMAKNPFSNDKAPVPAAVLPSVQASPSASSSSTPAKLMPSFTKSKALPFNKTDRRAKAEKKSKLKALKVRAQKGLLSEEEKQTLAAEEAAAADEKDCLVM